MQYIRVFITSIKGLIMITMNKNLLRPVATHTLYNCFQATYQARRKQFSVGQAGHSQWHQAEMLAPRQTAREARPLGGSGGMPPQENFGFQAF